MTAVPQHECPRCGYDLTGVTAPGSRGERLEAVAKANADKPQAWECSRCVYDLRGQYAARGESERGTCSECGLEFGWFELLTRDQRVVKGFIEHTQGRWKTLLAAWRTWAWTLWPAGFWRRISIEKPMRVRRAWLWLLIVLGTPRLIATLINLLTWVEMWRRGQASTRSALSISGSELVFAGIRRFDRNGTVVWAFDEWPPPLLAMAAASITVLMMLLALPFTLGKARIHHQHIVRAWIYGLSPLVLPIGLHAVGSTSRLLSYAFARLGSPGFRDIFSGFADFVGGAARYWPQWGTVIAVWFAVYWWYVVSSGWRLDTPKRVWAVLMVGAFLAALSVMILQEQTLSLIVRWTW